MRKLFFIPLLGLFIISCNDKSDNASATSTDSSKTVSSSSSEIVYPYTPMDPYREWQAGDQNHVVTVMKSLKGFETGDMEATVAGFGDTVDIRFDYLHTRLSNDSLKKFFAAERARYSNMTIKMSDWESVISKDKKTEYVTLWYRQIWTDKNGKTDSLAIIDDAKIVNGKIVELDEKIQHFPAKK